MNVKVKHHVVGPWQQGAVVPRDAVEGGAAEVDRLVRLGAVEFTDDAPTVFAPLAATAVAELPDDELARENRRLRAELDRRADAQAEAVRLAGELEAAKQAQADLRAAADKVAALEAQVEDLKADRAEALNLNEHTADELRKAKAELAEVTADRDGIRLEYADAVAAVTRGGEENRQLAAERDSLAARVKELEAAPESKPEAVEQTAPAVETPTPVAESPAPAKSPAAKKAK